MKNLIVAQITPGVISIKRLQFTFYVWPSCDTEIPTKGYLRRAESDCEIGRRQQF